MGFFQAWPKIIELSIYFQAMINTNYLAGVFTSHAVIKKMKERRKGHVVFVSSIGGQVCVQSLSSTLANQAMFVICESKGKQS